MTMNIEQEVGSRIRKLRKDKGLTQEELGEKAGLSYKHIGEVERGEVNPSLTTLAAIAKGLDVGIGDLFEKELFYLTDEKVKTINNALDSLVKAFKCGKAERKGARG